MKMATNFRSGNVSRFVSSFVARDPFQIAPLHVTFDNGQLNPVKLRLNKRERKAKPEIRANQGPSMKTNEWGGGGVKKREPKEGTRLFYFFLSF